MNFLSMSQMYSNIYHSCQKDIPPHNIEYKFAQAIEGLDVDILQKVIGKAAVKHGLEFVNKVDRVHYHDQREPEHNTSHLDPNGVCRIVK